MAASGDEIWVAVGVYTPGATPAATFQLTTTAVTLTVVSAAPNPSACGQTITLTASLSAASPASGTPTSSVAFKDNGAIIPGCSAQAVDGSR